MLILLLFFLCFFRLLKSDVATVLVMISGYFLVALWPAFVATEIDWWSAGNVVAEGLGASRCPGGEASRLPVFIKSSSVNFEKSRADMLVD